MRYCCLLIAAAVIITANCVPVSAVTIQPGSYKLEWKVPKTDSDVCFAGRTGVVLSMLSETQASEMPGLASACPYSGKTDRFSIILDESRGTGKGWDTAYITRISERGIDKAVKIQLKREDNTLKPSSRSGATIELITGGDGSQKTRKAAIDLEIYLEADQEGNLCPSFAMLTLRGGWYGKLKTDSGELVVQSVDLNENSIYGDEFTIDTGNKLPVTGDALIFGDSPQDFDDYSNMAYLGRIISYDGSLYECEVSSTGESLEIKAYEGETGILSFDPRDGFGKQAQCRRAVVYAHCGIFSAGNGAEILVPPGDYRCLTAVVLPMNMNAGDDVFSVFVQRKTPVTVVANGSSPMRLGGPVDVLVDQESDIIELSAGGSKSIKLSLAVGDDGLVGLEGPSRAHVNIRDERGKLLSSEAVEMSSSGVCDYKVSIPAHWKPGTYTLGVAFESPDYQKPTYAHKMLRVTK